MIDIRYIREHTEKVRENLDRRKNPEILKMFDELVEKDKKKGRLRSSLTN